MKRTIRLKESELKRMIAESVRRVLNEGKKETFSYETLTNISDYTQAYKYCVQELGDCIGQGSSRAVFQVDDEKCLKLAINHLGIEQNKVESKSNSMNSPLFPYVYRVAPNYTWLETEFVLPAEEQDVYQCLGLNNQWDFYDLIDLIKSIKYDPDNEYDLDQYIRNDKYGMIERLKEYILDYDIPIGDIQRLDNWGLAKRNGKEYMVILDPGWTKETMKLYGGWPSA